MAARKVLALGLLALFSVPAVADLEGLEHCMPVSFETLQSIKVQDQDLRLGPKGLYGLDKDSNCVYVDASAKGGFAKDHPEEHDSFLSIVDGFKIDTPQLAKLDFLDPAYEPVSTNFTPRGARAEPIPKGLLKRAECKDLCMSDWSTTQTCYSCSCKYRTTVCSATTGQLAFCVAYYYCQ